MSRTGKLRTDIAVKCFPLPEGQPVRIVREECGKLVCTTTAEIEFGIDPCVVDVDQPVCGKLACDGVAEALRACLREFECLCRQWDSRGETHGGPDRVMEKAREALRKAGA